MANQIRIELKKSRTFTELLNVVFEFIRREFKPFMRAMIYIAGPFILLSAIMFSLMIGNMFSLFLFQDFSLMEAGFVLYVFLFLILSTLGQVMVLLVTLEYMDIYDKEQHEEITVRMVWENVKKSFWGTVGHMVILILIFFGAYIVFLLVFAVFSIVGAAVPVLGFFVSLIPLILIIWLMVVFQFYFPIYIFERKTISDMGYIFRRCFQLIKSYWWYTFGIMFVLGLVVGTVSSLFFVPPYVMLIVDLFESDVTSDAQVAEAFETNYFLMIFWGIFVAVRILGYFLILMGFAFQYFNLREKKEAVGLMQSISSIGSPSDSSGGDFDENEDY